MLSAYLNQLISLVVSESSQGAAGVGDKWPDQWQTLSGSGGQ